MVQKLEILLLFFPRGEAFVSGRRFFRYYDIRIIWIKKFVYIKVTRHGSLRFMKPVFSDEQFIIFSEEYRPTHQAGSACGKRFLDGACASSMTGSSDALKRASMM